MASVEKVREEAVPDMTAISDLDEEKMLKNLEDRYLHSATTEPYTYVSTVLVAINPLKKIVGPTNENFFNTAFNPNIPHPNALAELAFQRLNSEHNQSIVVSGESGAGKTETSKMVVQYLSERSFAQGLKDQEQNPLTPTTTGGMKDLATRIVAISPVLEAFGNASTHRNPNSSRFGRFVKLLFQKHHFTSYQSGGCFRLIGGELETYLLEKSRVVRQSKGERNFHAMHMMLEEVPSTSLEKNMLHQKDGHKNTNDDDNEIIFRCMPYSAKKSIEVRTQLSQQAGKSVPLYKNVALSLKAIQMNDSTIHNAWDILGAIAILADFEFYENENNAQQATAIIDHSDHRAIKVTQLLGLESPQALIHALCYRTVQTKSENLQVGRTSIEARAARDAACRCIYGRLFDSLVTYCNRALNNNDDDKDEGQDSTEASSKSPTPTCKFIGILDIFGFEIMEYNGLETLLINYANESLQQLFCDAIFNAELSLYAAEGILTDEVRALKPPDSRPALELIVGKGSPPGILRLLDAQCETGGNDKANERERIFLSSIHSKHAKHMALAATPPQKKRQLFHISHYAAQVGYTVVNETFISDGWVTTNLDQIPSGLFEALSLSRLPLVLHLASTTTETFNDTTTKSPESTSNTANFFNSSSNQESSSSARPRKMNGSRLKTVSSRFIASMASLNSTLAATDCGFIRCIKPTPRMIPNIFDIDYVREQLRALGLVAATEVLRIGLPQRIEYDQLLAMLPENARKQLNGESKELIVACTLSAFEVSADDYRLGNTRVFFPASALDRINDLLAFDENSDPKRAARIAERLLTAKKTAGQVREYISNAREALVLAHTARGRLPAEILHIASSTQCHDDDEVLLVDENSVYETIIKSAQHATEAVSKSKKMLEQGIKKDSSRYPSAQEMLISIEKEEKRCLEAVKKAEKAQAEAVKQREAIGTAAKIMSQAAALVKSTINAIQETEKFCKQTEAAARRLHIADAKSTAAGADKSAAAADKFSNEASVIKLPAISQQDTRAALQASSRSVTEASQDAYDAAQATEQVLAAVKKLVDEERIEIERMEAERLEAERLKAERLEAERREAECQAQKTASKKITLDVDTPAEDEKYEEEATPAASPLETTLPPLEKQVQDAKDEFRRRLSSSSQQLKDGDDEVLDEIDDDDDEDEDEDEDVPSSPMEEDYDDVTENEESNRNIEIRRHPRTVAANLRTFRRWFVLEEVSRDDPMNDLPPTPVGNKNNSVEPLSPPVSCRSGLRDLVYRGIHMPPLDLTPAEKRHGLLHCIVKRKKGGVMSAPQFELYLTCDPEKLLLVAKRPSAPTAIPSYAIYEESSNGKRVLRARIRDSTLETNKGKTTDRALFGHQRALRGGAPREIGVILSPLLSDRSSTNDKKASTLRSLLAASQNAPEFHPELPVFVQRDPAKKDNRYSLDFKGRGKVASVKNFQLVTAARNALPEDKTVLQFCKVSANRFHLDFYRISPLAAFALAVSTCLT